MPDYGILTMRDVIALESICHAAQTGATVARLVESGTTIYGTARSIGTEAGIMARDVDIRDLYLRVTSTAGTEMFWRVADLMPQVSSGEFITDYAMPDAR